jgi:hypothetical protein
MAFEDILVIANKQKINLQDLRGSIQCHIARGDERKSPARRTGSATWGFPAVLRQPSKKEKH